MRLGHVICKLMPKQRPCTHFSWEDLFMDLISKRITNTVNIPEERLSVVPPVPKSIKIEITAHCDLKCFFCQVAITERTKGHIDAALLRRILDEAKAAGVEEVGLFWLGESFINRSLADYVAYAKKIGFERVFVTTNGRLADAKRLKPVFDAGLDSLKFSMNASSKESFKSTTGVDAYDQVLANIRSASELRGDLKKPMIYASSVFDTNKPEDYEEIDRQISPYVDEHYPLRLYGDYTLDSNKQEVVQLQEKNRALSDMLPCWSLFTIPH
jgi:pyruvate-formate lyase-activating enzyme